MPDFQFGQGPIGSGGTGPAPVIRDVVRQISPSDRPVDQGTAGFQQNNDGNGGTLDGIITAAQQQIAAELANQRARAQLQALQIPVQFADP